MKNLINARKLKKFSACRKSHQEIPQQKIWKFLWHEESIESWIVCMVLATIIMLLFLKLLGVLLSTPLPLVIIESESMKHNVGFDKWWDFYGGWYEDKSINKEIFKNFLLSNGINKGDIALVIGKKEYNTGDVVVFSIAQQKKPIIHRLVAENPFSTKGDNNNYQLTFETNINKKQILGKAVARVPKLGYIKLLTIEALHMTAEAFSNLARLFS